MHRMQCDTRQMKWLVASEGYYKCTHCLGGNAKGYKRNAMQCNAMAGRGGARSGGHLV